MTCVFALCLKQDGTTVVVFLKLILDFSGFCFTSKDFQRKADALVVCTYGPSISHSSALSFSKCSTDTFTAAIFIDEIRNVILHVLVVFHYITLTICRDHLSQDLLILVSCIDFLCVCEACHCSSMLFNIYHVVVHDLWLLEMTCHCCFCCVSVLVLVIASSLFCV